MVVLHLVSLQGTQRFIAQMGFKRMTPVQAITIPLLLKQRDVAVEASCVCLWRRCPGAFFLSERCGFICQSWSPKFHLNMMPNSWFPKFPCFLRAFPMVIMVQWVLWPGLHGLREDLGLFDPHFRDHVPRPVGGREPPPRQPATHGGGRHHRTHQGIGHADLWGLWALLEIRQGGALRKAVWRLVVKKVKVGHRIVSDSQERDVFLKFSVPE